MTIEAFRAEAADHLGRRFWRAMFWAESTAHLRRVYWRSEFREQVEAILFNRELAANEFRNRERKRQDMAMKMADLFAGPLFKLGQEFGPELTINGLLDLACGMTATTFPEEKLAAIFAAMAQRVRDSDWMRAQARHRAAQGKRLAVVGGARRSPGGIILPK